MASSANAAGTRLWRSFSARRSLLYQLVRRDFKQRYVGSILGWLWTVIHPLMLLAVYTFVFRYALGAKLPADEVTESYPLFLVTGLLPWLWFAETVTRSATSLTENSVLIVKSVFPAGAIPASIAASCGVAHVVSLCILLVAAAAWGHTLSWTLCLLPLYVALLALLSLGWAWIVAGLQVYLRDTVQVLSVILAAWFWMTPVFLPESFYRGRLDIVLDWNPIRYAVRGYRDLLLGGTLPSLADVLVLSGFAAGSFLLGVLFFRRAKLGFADVL